MILNGKVINPGDLRMKITLLSRSVSTETGGFPNPGYAVIAQSWAKWENVHGAEVWTAQAAQAQQPATVLIRYREGLDLTCAVYDGWVGADPIDEARVYEIVSLDDIRQLHEFIELKVQRVRSG